MNVRSLKLAGATAGLLFLVGAAPLVHAQSTQVLSMNNFSGTSKGSATSQTHSKFTFLGSLILTEVGFATRTGVTPTFYYQINSGVLNPVNVLSTTKDSYNVAWHTLETPMQMNTGDSVKLFNYDGSNSALMRSVNGVQLAQWTSTTPGVTYAGLNGTGTLYTAGNLRVSNPSANVAPEPASIALLLTGGGALAGIALRRRRNAA
jgi:hypothetical protein